MTASGSAHELAAGLAAAQRRLTAAPAPEPACDRAEQAVARLRAACESLRRTDLEVRRARTRIARLAAEAASRTPVDAA